MACYILYYTKQQFFSFAMAITNNILTVDTIKTLFKIQFCNFFHSNFFKAVVRLLLGEKYL